MKKLNKEGLLGLGFKEERVSALESGDAPYIYYAYLVKDCMGGDVCILLSNTDDEAIDGNYQISFSDYPEIGIYEDYEVVENLISILDKIEFKNI